MTTVKPDLGRVAPTTPAQHDKQENEAPKEMLSVSEQDGKRKVRINSSSLSIILACLRKAEYSLLRQMRSRSESPALTFGKAIHKALEVFYSHPRAERAFPAKFKEHARLMAHGHEAPEPHFLYEAVRQYVAEAQPLAGLPETDKRSISNGIWILTHYFETYLTDPYVVLSDESGPITERTFSLPLHEDDALTIELFGTVDVVLRNEANGQIVPADHKTASQLGSDFFNRLKPNHQYTGYLLGAQQVLGLETQSFMVNALQVKPKPLTNRGTPPHFTRQITTRTPEEITEFKQSVRFAVTNYLHAMDTGVWPIGNVDNCAMWGGCQFLEVCSAPANLRENILESKFKTQPKTQ